jgi:hypothetical protein
MRRPPSDYCRIRLMPVLQSISTSYTEHGGARQVRSRYRLESLVFLLPGVAESLLRQRCCSGRKYPRQPG